MANVPISKMQVPGSNDVLLLRDGSAANLVTGATNGNLAGLDANGNLTDSGVSASSIGNLSGSHLGTCETAASTSAKIVTIGDGTWIPKEGDIIAVKFTYSNTALFVTLNANGIGNKSIWYGDSVDHSGADYICGKADSYIFYMYDGTYWIWLNEGQHDGNTFPSVAVYTASNQQIKIGTCNYYTLTNKSYCHFIFRYANSYKGELFIKINNSSSKTIYINGEISSSTNYTLPAGTYIAYYENDKWYFRTDGILPAKTTEGAEINERLDKTTTSASGNPISITGLKSNQLAVNPVITFEPIQAGSGDPSPSNVRAISGYDKIEVLSCGKNLLDSSTLRAGDYNGATPTLRVSQDLNKRARTIAGKTYACSFTANSKCKAQAVVLTDASNTIIETIANFSQSQPTVTFTATRTGDYITVVYGGEQSGGTWSTLTPSDVVGTNPQIEEDSATAYEPYNKTTDLSENLPQTVYGMTLYLREGKGVIDQGIYDLGDTNWRYNSTYSRFEAISPIPNMKSQDARTLKFLCSCYKCISDGRPVSSVDNNSIYSVSTDLYVHDSRYTDATQFKTAVAGQKIVYPLETPIEIQLTPHEISLLKDYAYVSTNGTSIALDYHNGEIATLGDVAELSQVVENSNQYTKEKYGFKSGVFGVATTANVRKIISSASDIVDGKLPDIPNQCCYSAIQFSTAIPNNLVIGCDNTNIFIYCDATNTRVRVRWIQSPYF